MVKILVAIAGWYDFHWSVLEAAYKMDAPQGTEKDVIVFTGRHSGETKNKTVTHAIIHNYDLIFFMDADAVVKQDTLSCLYNSLVEKSIDWVTGIARGNYSNLVLNFTPYDETKNVKENWFHITSPVPQGVFRINASGFHCLLARTSAFRKIEYPYFLFTEELNEDVYCYEKLRGKVECYCDGRVRVGHMKRVVL